MLTSKLNQDILENFFSLIRGVGGYNTHPGPVEAINRIRIILLGKDPEHIVSNPAVEVVVEVEEEESKITSRGIDDELKDKMKESQTSSGEYKVNSKEEMECDFRTLPLVSEDEQEAFISKEITQEIETGNTKIDEDIEDYEELMKDHEKSKNEDDEDTDDDDSTSEVLHYISGFIANKLKSKHPQLVTQESSTKRWIDLKSRGHIVYPSSDLFHLVTILEKEFCIFHGKTVDMNKDPIGRLVAQMSQNHPHVPKDIISLFVKIRFFHRIKHLNVAINKLGHHMIRCLKQKGQFIF